MPCPPLFPHTQLSDRKVLMSSPQRLTSATPLAAADPSGQDPGLSEPLVLPQHPCLHCHCRSNPSLGQATAASICCSSLGRAKPRTGLLRKGPEDSEEPPRGTGGG